MATPNYSPASGYGTQSNGYYFAQSPAGGSWSTRPASMATAPTRNYSPAPATFNSPAPTQQQSNPQPSNQGGQQEVQAPNPPSGYSDQELNSAFNPLMDYLNQAESQLRSDLPTYQKEINSQVDTSKAILGNQRTSTLGTLDTQQQAGQRRKEDVVSASRRLFNELQMANTQRFGGATSAGQAAGELQGREFQRSTAQANQGFNDLVRELDNKRLEVDNNYQLNVRQLEDKRQASINDVSRQFQEKLLEINRQRTEVESQKAQRRLAALDQYRQQVFQIQLQNYQFKQQLESMRQQASIQLDSYQKQLGMAGQQGQSMLNQYGTTTTTAPTTQFGIGAQQPAQQSQQQYTGQISSFPMSRNDDLFGSPQQTPSASLAY